MHVFTVLWGVLWASSVWGASSSSYVDGEVIIKLRAQTVNSKTVSKVNAQHFFAKAQTQMSFHIVRSWSELSMHHVKLDSNQSVEDAVASFSQMSEVQYAEPNYIVKKAAEGYSAEGYYSLAQAQSFGGTLTTAPIQMSQAQAEMVPGKTPVTVAVIDTGIDFTHPVFQNTVWTNPSEIPNNGIDDDQNGYVDDVNGWNWVANTNSPSDDEGHGTHVSGIVLGVGENIFSTSVPLEYVKIMPLKFLDSTGSGSTANAISAIYYAAQMGAKVMNNSWGGGSFSLALSEAIGYAYSLDVLFVAAAGNSTSNNDAVPSYPASYDAPNVVSVAATDTSDVIAYFSNYGQQTVPLTAPGVSVLSTYPVGQYAQMSGTSMASPFVAGTAALMRNQNPAMNCYQIKSLIEASVDVKSNLASYVSTSGRVNVNTAVSIAQTTAVNSYEPAYNAQQDAVARGLASASSASTTGCGLVSLVDHDFGGSADAKGIIVLFALLFVPVMVWYGLKRQAPVSRRKHERFELNSSVSFKVGDQELMGAVHTISMGGSDLSTEALLKDGSLITMTISSPDGVSKIDVQGHVVWSQQNKRYGIAFNELEESLKNQIGALTTNLKKAA